MEHTPLLKSSSAESVPSVPAPNNRSMDSTRPRQPGRSSGDNSGGVLDRLGSAGTRQYLAGVSLLLGVVTLWSLSDFISAALQTGDHAWNKPFLCVSY